MEAIFANNIVLSAAREQRFKLSLKNMDRSIKYSQHPIEVYASLVVLCSPYTETFVLRKCYIICVLWHNNSTPLAHSRPGEIGLDLRD
jgi:hypothetical protein